MMACALSSSLSASEYVICLLPDEASAASLSGLSKTVQDDFSEAHIPFLKEPNIPHVSLFQGVFNEDSLPSLTTGLRTIADRFYPVTVQIDGLRDTLENIFLVFKNPESVAPVSNSFFTEGLHQLRAPGKLLEQVDRKKESEGLSDEESKMIDLYGLFWGVPGSYNPHFIVVYESNIHLDIEKRLKGITCGRLKKVSLNKIGFGKMNPGGNLVDLIQSFPLKKG